MQLHPFTARLEQLIEAEKLNRRRFAQALGYESPEKIYRLWREDNARPGFDIVEDIARIFDKYSVEWLLTGKGEMLKKPAATPTAKATSLAGYEYTEHAPPIVEEPSGRKSGRISAGSGIKKVDIMPKIITVDSGGRENILYVPAKAYAGYLVGYSDPEYLGSLQAFSLPELRHGTFRMFEVKGPSMAPTIADEDRVIGEYVSSFDDIKDGRVYVLVTHSRGIVLKRVLNRLSERGKLVCKSDTIAHKNEYRSYQLNPEDIKEIWYCRLKFSADFSEPSDIYHRIDDLESEMAQVKQNLAEISLKNEAHFTSDSLRPTSSRKK